MLRVVVVCGFLFLLFIVLSFPAVTVLMARFPTVAAGFGMAISEGRFW
jgi:hypothetical protein